MRFQAAAQIAEGVVDVDPITDPATIILAHVMRFKGPTPVNPAKLMLALIGDAVEAVTVDLHFLIEDGDELSKSSPAYLQNADRRWFQFDSALVVTNGTLVEVTSGLPAGGIIYAQVTAESIGSSETRSLLAAWV